MSPRADPPDGRLAEDCLIGVDSLTRADGRWARVIEWLRETQRDPATPLTDRLHVALALGPLRSRDRRADSLPSPLVLPTVLSGPNIPNWIYQRGDEMRVVLSAPHASPAIGQAHLGQLAWYAAQLDASSYASIDDQLSPLDAVSMNRLVVGDLDALVQGAETEWLVPALVAWRAESLWTDHFGRSWSLDKLAQRLLDEGADGRACFGGHYWESLVVIGWSADGRISAHVRDLARARVLAQWSLFEAKWQREVRARSHGTTNGLLADAARVAELAHTLMWVGRLLPILDARDARNTLTVREIAGALSGEILAGRSYGGLGDLCHAVQAIRRVSSFRRDGGELP